MASSEWLVRKLHEQDKKIEALSRGGTGVGHSSIAPGENLTVISDNGEVVLGAGGVEHVDGPTPATPSAPTLKLGFGTIETTWDGTFAEGEDEDGVPLTAPVDFDVVEVHCSTDPEEEEWGEDTMRGQIKTREGGTVTVGGFDVDDEVFVCLIALAKTGKRSEPSATASLVVEGLDFSQLFTEIDAANATIKNAGEVLVTEQGTLDEKLTEVDGTLNDLGQDLQAVEDAQAQLNTDLTDVMTSVDGKNTITWNPSAPSKVSTPGKAVGDLWYRTSGNNIVGFWKWDGTDWVTQLLDKTTIPLIDIGAGTFGSLSGVRLEAGTVAASSIAVGDFSNLATIDPVRNVNVTRPANWSTETVGDYITPKAASQNYLMFKDRTNTVPFKAGDQLRVELKGVSDVDGSARIRLWGYPALADGTTSGLVGVSGDSFSFTTTEQSFSGKVTIPSSFGASTTLRSWIIGLGPQGGLDLHGVRVRDVRVYRMTDTTLIQDGGVTTPKLSADVLEVKNLKATTGQLDEAVINKLFSDVVVTKMAVAEQFIGENAILTGAVTAPKITASEELWAKIGQFVKIRAEHIEADAIDGMVITGGTYRTSGGNGSWSDAGLFISESDGTSLVRFPTNGEPLSLTASDTNIDRASVGELDVSNGAVRSGGTMSLAAGVTAPASPPELTSAWALNTTLPRPPEPSMDWTGFAVWNGLYVRGVNVLGSAGDPYDRIEVYNTDGTLNKKISIDLNPRAGVAVIGDIVYTIGPDHVVRSGAERQWCHGFNLNTGARVSRWEFTRFTAQGQKQFTVGTDGTNLLTAGVTPTPSLYVMKYNPSTGAQIGGEPDPPSTGGDMIDAGWDISARDLYGVHQSGSDLYITHRGYTRVYTVSGYTLTRKADSSNASGWAGWRNPNGSAGGITFVGGVPVVVDSDAVYKGSTAASDYTRELCFTWYDGTHETTASPVAVVDVAARETVTVSLPVRAGLQKRLYARAQGVTNWARATVAADATAVPVSVGLSLYTPPTTNTFPSNVPAVLKSATGNFEVNGNGGGKWGPLTFNADGTMTGMRQTSSGTLDVAAPSGGGTTRTWVTFPDGRFTTTPTITTSLRSAAPNSASVSTGGATATGFYLYFYRVNNNLTGVNWIATEEG